MMCVMSLKSIKSINFFYSLKIKLIQENEYWGINLEKYVLNFSIVKF